MPWRTISRNGGCHGRVPNDQSWLNLAVQLTETFVRFGLKSDIRDSDPGDGSGPSPDDRRKRQVRRVLPRRRKSAAGLPTEIITPRTAVC